MSRSATCASKLRCAPCFLDLHGVGWTQISSNRTAGFSLVEPSRLGVFASLRSSKTNFELNAKSQRRRDATQAKDADCLSMNLPSRHEVLDCASTLALSHSARERESGRGL